MTAIEKQYPAYTGNEPYLHLCFSEASSKRVLALLRCLRLRGVRVWYGMGTSADRAVREAINRRMLEASLTVIYLDEAFRNDPVAKSKLLACQRKNHSIICLNTDGGDSRLSIGLHADACEVRLGRGASAEDTERELLHAEGFSQELIGEPEKPKKSRVKIMTAVIAALTAALLAAGVLVYMNRPEDSGGVQEDTPVPTDSVLIADETVRETVRSAIGGNLLTEERLKAVTSIRFTGDTLPDDLSGLELLPSLETVELSQQAAMQASFHPELSAYTVELYGGASE